MPRIKTTTATFQTRNEFEICVDEIAALQLKIDHDVAEFNAAKAAQDKAFKTRLKSQKERLAQKLSIAEMYAAHHRLEVLHDKQTAETKLATFGYRRSPGIVKTLNSRWTFAKALQALRDAGKTTCIKVTETLNKQAVKAEIPEPELSQYGLRLDYPEEFWIEAKRDVTGTEKRLVS